MKFLIYSVLFAYSTGAALGASMSLRPCSTAELVSLQETIKEKKAEGLVNAKVMKNSKNQTLGLYTWSKSADDIYAEVCEYLDTAEQTVANTWYYWQGDRAEANPGVWKKNSGYLIQQDEGSMSLQAIKASARGDVKVKIEIEGVDEVIVKSQTVNFADL